MNVELKNFQNDLEQYKSSNGSKTLNVNTAGDYEPSKSSAKFEEALSSLNPSKLIDYEGFLKCISELEAFCEEAAELEELERENKLLKVRYQIAFEENRRLKEETATLKRRVGNLNDVIRK